MFQLLVKNESPKPQNLGLTIETFNKRKQQNIISFLGEFVVFLIESLFAILVLFCHEWDKIVWFMPFIGISSQATLVIIFFWASPELKRFYGYH